MPSYSSKSLAQRATLDPLLQSLFDEVLKHWDHTLLEGKRTLEQQKINVAKGVSKTLNSKHVTGDDPSLAVDAAPFPIDWPDFQLLKNLSKDQQDTLWKEIKDFARFYHFAGFVLGVASQKGIAVRHGGDWDMDQDIHDQNFDDLPHFELI